MLVKYRAYISSWDKQLQSQNVSICWLSIVEKPITEFQYIALKTLHTGEKFFCDSSLISMLCPRMRHRSRKSMSRKRQQNWCITRFHWFVFTFIILEFWKILDQWSNWKGMNSKRIQLENYYMIRSLLYRNNQNLWTGKFGYERSRQVNGKYERMKK